MIGAAPPPYNGSIMMFWTLMTSSLKDHFRLVHLDISDHRGLENIARLDFRNVYLALRHSLDCFLALRQERPDIVYVPIAMNPLAFFRDSVFLLLTRAFAWSGRGWRRRGSARGRSETTGAAAFQCVIHAHGGHFDRFYRQCPAFFRAYIRWCLKDVMAIVHSEALVPMFSGLVPGERVWPVSNGIAGVPDHLWRGKRPSVFTRSPLGKAPERLEPGRSSCLPDAAPGRAPVVLYLGNLLASKGFLDVMAAAPLVARVVPGVRFVVAGPYHYPSDREQAERLMRDPEIQAVVELPGAVTGDARFEQMLESDLFVFPSYNEGQPTVLLEAMSAGLPVITTDDGAIRDTIVDRETGFLVPKGDPAAIAERVIELLRDEPLRRRMGAAGRRRFEQQFGVETYGANMVRVFEAALSLAEQPSDNQHA